MKFAPIVLTLVCLALCVMYHVVTGDRGGPALLSVAVLLVAWQLGVFKGLGFK